MKTTKVLQAISLLLILVIAVGCRSSRSTSGKQYPRTTPTETPTNTTTVIVDNSNNLPPGQAKKVYGSQSAKAYAPGQQKKYAGHYPLVIVYSPAIVIKQHSDGRYFYKNTAGYTYWKGHDGRYYIDEKHLTGMKYEAKDYDDWKSRGQKNDKAQASKGKEQQEKEKQNQKAKDDKDIAKDKDEKDKEPKEKEQADKKEKGPADQKANNDNAKGKAKGKAKG